MKSLHVCILILGLLSACGDADSDSSKPMGPVNNANGANNLTSSNSGNPNSTTENNSANNTSGTNNTNSSSTNNTTTSNNPNNPNNSGTNNQTVLDPRGTLSCMDILGCLLGCHADNEVCESECRALGTDTAKEEIDAFLGCVDFHCAEAMTVTALTECTLSKCSDEQNTCLGTR